MSQPITHYFVAREALLNTQLWDGYAKYIALGTLGPDLFYMHNPVITMGLAKVAKVVGAFDELAQKQKAYEELADAIHRERSLDAFVVMVAMAAANYRSDSDVEKDQACRQISFALGFFAHVITDCSIHPLVYRVAGDHWLEHPEPGYTQHKIVEASLDRKLSLDVHGDLADEARRHVIGCTSDSDDDQLDESVRSIFLAALRQCYPEELGKIPAFSRNESGDNHPLNQSFKDVRAIVGYLYEAGMILQSPWKLHLPQLVTQAQKIGRHLDERTEAYISRGNAVAWRKDSVSQSLSLNAFELIDRAVAAIRCLNNAVFVFLEDSSKQGSDDLRKILAEYGYHTNVPYLQENFNLDTGLPARNNGSAELTVSGDGWYDCGVEELKLIYEKLHSNFEDK